MADVEDLRIILRAEVEKAIGDMKKASRQSKQSGKDWSDLNKKFKDQVKQSMDLKKAYGQMTAQVAAGIGVYEIASATFQAMAQFVRGSVQAFGEQEQAVAKLEAVLRATGGAAGLTSREMQDFASELQSATTYGDEAILNIQGTLATFKSVSGDTFKDATRLALDLSAAFGQDLQSSAMQVGKALEDPIRGMSALQRVGVTFSEAQRQVIENLVATGNTAEAQRQILRELEGQVGGVAEAMADTATGAMQQYRNAIDDMKEEIGRFIVTGLEPLSRVFTQVALAIQGVLKEQNDYNAALKAVQAGTATVDQRLIILAEERRQLEQMIRLMDSQKGLAEELGGHTKEQYDFAVAQLQAIRRQQVELAAAEALRGKAAESAKKRADEEAAIAEKARIEREALDVYLARVNAMYAQTSAGRIAMIEKEIAEFEAYAKTAKLTAPRVAAVLAMLQEQRAKLLAPEATAPDPAAPVAPAVTNEVDENLERLQQLYSRTAEGIAEANAETLKFVSAQRAAAEASGASAAELAQFDAILRDLAPESIDRTSEILANMNSEIASMLSNVVQGGLVDGFVAIGEALASGDDGGQAFAQAMQRAGADALRQVSVFALAAGVRILAETGKAGLPVALALFALAGVSAVGSGAISGAMAGPRTVDYDQYITDPVVEAEKRLAEERLRILSEHLDREKRLRDENLRKLEDHFSQEFEVLRDLWDRGLISTAEYTSRTAGLRAEEERQRGVAEKPVIEAEEAKRAEEEAQRRAKEALEQARTKKLADLSREAAKLQERLNDLDFWERFFTTADEKLIEKLTALDRRIRIVQNAQTIEQVHAAATGADYVTHGPELLMVGDNPGGRERVRIDPIGSPNMYGPGGGGVVIQIFAPVYGIEDLYEKLERAAQKLEGRGRRRGVIV